MLLENDIKSLLASLLSSECAEVVIDGAKLSLCLTDPHVQEILISTEVYLGGNYIPKGVRSCISKVPTFSRHHLSTQFVVDENEFSIALQYKDTLRDKTITQLVDMLEDFSWLAEQWRQFIDDHDRNDLVYIHAKK